MSRLTLLYILVTLLQVLVSYLLKFWNFKQFMKLIFLGNKLLIESAVSWNMLCFWENKFDSSVCILVTVRENKFDSSPCIAEQSIIYIPWVRGVDRERVWLYFFNYFWSYTKNCVLWKIPWQPTKRPFETLMSCASLPQLRAT